MALAGFSLKTDEEKTMWARPLAWPEPAGAIIFLDLKIRFDIHFFPGVEVPEPDNVLYEQFENVMGLARRLFGLSDADIYGQQAYEHRDRGVTNKHRV